MVTRLVIAALLIASASFAASARAAVQRCIAPDGQTIYTDRSCGAFDARPAGTFDGPGRSGAAATIGVDGAVGGFAIRGCARTPEALLQGVRDALLAHDVNRLANYYHWSGTGTSAATALMTRLERLVDGPSAAADLVPAYSPTPRYVASVPAPSVPAPSADAPWWRAPAPPPRPAPALPTGPSGDDATGTAAAPADAAPAPPPVGLRVTVGGAADAASSTTFALRRNAGCWWIQF